MQLRQWLSDYKSGGGAVIVTAREVETNDSLWDIHLEIQPAASKTVRLQLAAPPAPSAVPARVKMWS